MDLEGAFLELEGVLLHSLAKSEGTMAPLAPRFIRPCFSEVVVMMHRKGYW